MKVLKTFEIDPDAVLPYGFNWTEWLADVPQLTPETQTIVSVLWIGSGLTVAGQAENDTKAIVVLRDAVATADGYAYATCRITTSLGYKDDRSLRFKVKDR